MRFLTVPVLMELDYHHAGRMKVKPILRESPFLLQQELSDWFLKAVVPISFNFDIIFCCRYSTGPMIRGSPQ